MTKKEAWQQAVNAVLLAPMTKDDILVVKKKYNELLLRHEKAVMYLDDTTVPAMQKEKWLPEFQNLVHEMDFLIKTIQDQGRYVTMQNILNGFYYEESEEKTDG